MNHNSFTPGLSIKRLQRFRNTIEACQLVANQVSQKISELKAGPSIRRATFRDNESISKFIRHHYLYKGPIASEVLRSDEELKNINTAYGAKDAFFGVMSSKGEMLGTIGFKRFDDQNCELKKFHLRSGYADHKSAKQLLHFALAQAKAMNYLGCIVRILPGDSELSNFLISEGFEMDFMRENSSVKTASKVLV